MQVFVLPDFLSDFTPRGGMVTETPRKCTTMVVAVNIFPVKSTASGVSVQTEHDELGVISPHSEQNGLDFDYIGHDGSKTNFENNIDVCSPLFLKQVGVTKNKPK
mmetsp:Transcript_30271/g.64888  ORF Transcript_30271/g.64888 Transcript_30271/m.64888 type:complete len:105 (-) Transcript_30271:163-477(-)